MPLDNARLRVEPKRRGRPPKVKPEAVIIPPLTEAEILAANGVKTKDVKVSKPKIRTAPITIEGISPYVQHKFGQKSIDMMQENQEAGQQAKGKKKRDPKDINAVYEACKHISEDGWIGIPASAFRNAMIDACRLIGFKMTVAKLSVFVEADGIEKDGDGTPLVRIIGKEHMHRAPVRNATGVADIRWRPMWKKWRVNLRLTWDEDQFSATDVTNLLLRAGMQVGIGEGRPGSPNSFGVGWGRFKIEGMDLDYV